MRVLFFIGTLRSGGKERRLIELLTYLKQKEGYELLVIIAFGQIDYPSFYELDINHIILNKKPKFKDPGVFFQLQKICKKFNPDIIHTWGSMQTFYMIPASILLKIPLVNSQITSAPPHSRKPFFQEMVNLLNFRFSKIIISNSKAGLISYGFELSNKKCRVIYNGFNAERIQNLPTKTDCRKKFGIESDYAVLMVGSFTKNKDYRRFLDVCRQVSDRRKDITFIAAGDGKNLHSIKELAVSLGLSSIKFTGRITNVEELVNACDIGVLFTNNEVHGEGISNSIMEYMALGKPVIANDAGGTREIVAHSESGYLITNQSNPKIADMIIELIDNHEKRLQFGKKGGRIVKELFSLDKMGDSFNKLYKQLLN